MSTAKKPDGPDISLIGLPAEDAERRSALLKRWRTIILLLRFVLSIINNHPHLDALGRKAVKKEALKKQRVLFKIIEAVALILVRRHEIVAVTAALTRTMDNSKLKCPFTAMPFIQLIAISMHHRGLPVSDQQEGDLEGGAEAEVDLEQTDSWLSATIRQVFKDIIFKFTCIANPPLQCPQSKVEPTETDQRPTAPKPDQTYVFSPPGVSHMPVIIGEEGPWKMLSFPADPLQNHIATIVDFLFKYKSGSDLEKSTLFNRVMEYIVATSWEVMERRVSHWSSTIFLYAFCKIDQMQLWAAFAATVGSQESNVEDEYSDGEDGTSNLESQRKDQVLINAMASMSDPQAQDLTNGVPSDIPIVNKNRELKKLRQAMHDANHGGPTFYNKDTYEEFHILVISALFKYRKALKEFRNYPKNPNANADPELQRLAKTIYLRGFLLWRIVFSKTFSRYISGLRGFIPTPDARHNEVAQTWLNSEPQSKGLISNALSVLGSAIGKGSPGSRAGSRENKGGSKARAESKPRSGDKNVHTDEEYDRQIDDEHGRLVAQSGNNLPLNWGRHLVSHFESLQTLTFLRQSDNLEPDAVHYSLLEVPPTPPDGTLDTEDWVEFVKNNLATALVKDGGFLTRWFREQMASESHVNASPEARKARHPFYVKEFLETGVLRWIAGRHCEALMGAFMKYGIEGDADGPQWLDDMGHEIAVSRRCCPICWDLLHYLDEHNGSRRFHVRDRHSTLYPVELPSQLPITDLEGMVQQYFGRLVQVVRTAVTAGDPPRGRTLSGQSIYSAHSVNSEHTVPEATIPPGHPEVTLA